MIKGTLLFLFGASIGLMVKTVFIVCGFNPEGWYAGWFGCFFTCLFALWVYKKEEE